MTIQLSSLDKVHQEINPEVVLEDIVHAHHERMLHIVQDILL
jgi:hypothetical protein